MDLDSLTIAELDAELERIDAARLALKAEGAAVMAVRGAKIAAESLHARENPTPVMGLPDQDRLKVLRAKAGVAEIKRPQVV
jgi:hypothetical protein